MRPRLVHVRQGFCRFRSTTVETRLYLLPSTSAANANSMLGDASDTIVELLQGGTEHVVSHPGRSQYSVQGGGASSCGLAALNCARLVLQNEQDFVTGHVLVQKVIERAFSEVRF